MGETMEKVKRLVVGISGASGAVLAIRLLKELQGLQDWETHLVISSGAKRTIKEEIPESIEEVKELASCVHDLDDIGASIASGTFKTEGMVVIPCSMKTLAGIAHGYSDNLLLRAADVTMKERRTLVLVARETPLNRIHLQNMAMLASFGVTLMPPMMTFYNHPLTIEDMQTHIVGKVLNEFGVEARDFRRWGGAEHSR
jgi:polyprenyl P-hydroxybenzoate/phenylacrylic acid decarboxylase-like protein